MGACMSTRTRPLLLCTLLCLGACSFRIDARDVAAIEPRDLGGGDPAQDLCVGHGPDLRAEDLRGPTPLPGTPDLAGGPCATVPRGRNDRACDLAAGAAGLCDGQGAFQPELSCTGAGCEVGYCTPPRDLVRCASDANCRGSKLLSCQVFTNLFNLSAQYCAPPPGLRGRLEPCARPGDCLWNACQDRRCIKPCAADADCDGSAGSCAPLTLSLEGFQVGISGCVR